MPTPLPPSALTGPLEWRYATKRFDPDRKIDPAIWSALERALVLSPSSFGLQPWRFVVIGDAGVRERLRAVSWNQPQITEASHLVVFAARTGLTPADVERHVQRTAAVRSVPVESLAGLRTMIGGFVEQLRATGRLDAWCDRQAYLALGTFLTSAALLGIDACPMEGIDPAAYDEILSLPAQGYHTLCVAAAGHRSPDDAYAGLAKVRFPVEEVITRV